MRSRVADADLDRLATALAALLAAWWRRQQAEQEKGRCWSQRPELEVRDESATLPR